MEKEKGLLGSKYFVQTCPFLSQIKGYLNFDMIVVTNLNSLNRSFFLYSRPSGL